MDDVDWKTKGMNQLLEDVRQRQRNFVFPDTVRNQGEFYRNLASGNYERRSWLRPLVAVYGILMLCEYLCVLAILYKDRSSLLGLVEIFAVVAVGCFVSFKIIVNAAFEKPPLPPPDFVIRRRKLMGRR
jgi:hypothetical protein